MQQVVDEIEQLYELALTGAQRRSFGPSWEADRAAAEYLQELNQRYGYGELLAFYRQKKGEEAEVVRSEPERERLAGSRSGSANSSPPPWPSESISSVK